MNKQRCSLIILEGFVASPSLARFCSAVNIVASNRPGRRFGKTEGDDEESDSRLGSTRPHSDSSEGGFPDGKWKRATSRAGSRGYSSRPSSSYVGRGRRAQRAGDFDLQSAGQKMRTLDLWYGLAGIVSLETAVVKFARKPVTIFMPTVFSARIPVAPRGPISVNRVHRESLYFVLLSAEGGSREFWDNIFINIHYCK
jgi:hypothetical protein